jgi:hypothetical protein
MRQSAPVALSAIPVFERNAGRQFSSSRPPVRGDQERTIWRQGRKRIQTLESTPVLQAHRIYEEHE